TMIGCCTSRRQQDQPLARAATPLLQFSPGVVTHDAHMIEIIHAGAAEVPVGYRKAGGLDDVGGHVEACAETENRPGVLRNIGLEKRYLHRVPAVPVSYEFSE